MARCAIPSKIASAAFLTLVILASLAGPAPADTAIEPSTMTVEEFLSLARRHVPLPEREYGVEYEYLVVEGTVEDIRFVRPFNTPRPPELKAFNVATILVTRTYAIPPQGDDKPTVVEIALVGAPYHDEDGHAVFRRGRGGGEMFDRLHVGDSIVVVAVRTSDATRQKVWYSGDERFTNVFGVVRQGDTKGSDVAIIANSESPTAKERGPFHQSTPWTMVDPSTYTRVFVSVPLSAGEVFENLVALVDAATTR